MFDSLKLIFGSSAITGSRRKNGTKFKANTPHTIHFSC